MAGVSADNNLWQFIFLGSLLSWSIQCCHYLRVRMSLLLYPLQMLVSLEVLLAVQFLCSSWYSPDMILRSLFHYWLVSYCLKFCYLVYLCCWLYDYPLTCIGMQWCWMILSTNVTYAFVCKSLCDAFITTTSKTKYMFTCVIPSFFHTHIFCGILQCHEFSYIWNNVCTHYLCVTS